MTVEINIEKIIEYLPHRYPFLLVDRVLAIEPHKSIRAIKNVTINEPFFQGHFPQKPVMPGVLILECLAQTCGVLTVVSFQEESRGKEYLYYLAGIDKARFKQVVSPGDQLVLDITVDRVIKDICKCQATASVDGKVVCSAEIMSARKEITHD